MRCIPLPYHPHMSPPPLGNCARRRIGWAWQPEHTVARTLWRRYPHTPCCEDFVIGILFPFPPLFWHTRGAVCGFVYCNLKALVSLGHTLVLHASCSPHPPTPGERSCLGVPTRTGMSICNIAIGAIAACGIRLSCLLRSLPLCQTLQHVAWPVCIGCHGDAAMPY